MLHIRSTVRRALPLALLAGTALALASPALAAETYLTSFAKTANISNNLNRNFPNTGATVAGSVNGVPNASSLYTPTPGANGDVADVLVRYNLTSDTLGRDYREIGGAGSSVTLLANVANASSVYFLMSAYFGTSVNFTLTGTGGATRTFSNIGIPDFNGGGSVDSVSGDTSVETVFSVRSVGAGGTGNSETGAFNTYYLYQIGLQLGPTLAGQGLLSATITSNGSNPLLLGATVLSPDAPTSAVPEPASWATMVVGFAAVGAGLRRRRSVAATA